MKEKIILLFEKIILSFKAKCLKTIQTKSLVFKVFCLNDEIHVLEYGINKKEIVNKQYLLTREECGV